MPAHGEDFVKPIILFALGLLSAIPAHANSSRDALDAATRAFRLDFERDGVVGSPDEVRGAYQEACDLGYGPACQQAAWHDEQGLPDLFAAAERLRGRCGRQDPVACMVSGWAIEAEPLPDALDDPAEIRTRKVDQLVLAFKEYRKGCYSEHPSSCHELARYSIERARLEGGADAERRERRAELVFRRYCRADYMPSCVVLGQLQPQVPEAMDDAGSAGGYYQQACDADHPEGCHQLGLLLAPQKSAAENRHWFDGLCDRGHTASCAWVARSYAEEDPDGDAALDAWKRACLLHDPEGCRRAGPALEDTRPAEAAQVHRMGCALGERASCGHLGLMLVDQGEYDGAVGNLDAGCEAGVVEACVKVGLLRVEGRHVEPDAQRALRDLVSGCPEDGTRHPEACHAVGRLYEDGFGIERDRSVAARYYRYACQGGHTQSCYRQGEAVRSLQRASQTDELLRWALQGYVKACDAGISEACLPAAELFASGPVALRDEGEARGRFDSLCEGGEARACRSYGLWLLDGNAPEDELSQARDAFERGMDLGDLESTRLLAKMYWLGKGGARKRRKANRLFSKACQAGYQPACGGMEQPPSY
jgi:uncharacterized protein